MIMTCPLAASRPQIRRWGLVGLLLLLSPLASAEEGHGSLLAVLELKNQLQGEEQKAISSVYFTDLVRSNALRAVPSLTLMTRENVLVLLEAQGKTLAECEGECEVQTGQRLGADFLISGEILRVGTTLKVNLRLHDTHSGSLLSGLAASGKSVDELDAAVAATVEQLVAPLAGTVPARATARNETGIATLSDELRNGESRVMQASTAVVLGYQSAMDAEGRGLRAPADAAVAWGKLAALKEQNPFQKAAELRARQWNLFAEKQAKQASKRKADFDKLRRLLVDPGVPESQKDEAFGASAGQYGVGPLVNLIALTQPESVRPTLLFKACAAGAGRACRQVGDDFKEKDEARAAVFWSRAATLLLRSCDEGGFADCEDLASMQRAGVGIAPDPTKAVLTSQRACDGGEYEGCTSVATAYREGQGVSVDQARSRDFAKRALALLRKACDDGDDRGCEIGARALEGEGGGTPDVAAALKLHERACELGNMHACTTVGEAYRYGNGTKKNPEKMTQLYLRACRGGVGHACDALGRAITLSSAPGMNPTNTRAAALYAHACDHGDAEGCAHLGAAFESGDGVAQSQARAAVWEAKGCELGSFDGCRTLARQSSPPPVDEKKTDAAFRVPCEQGKNATACYQLGHLYLNGEGLPKKQVPALSLLRRACDARVAAACSEIP